MVGGLSTVIATARVLDNVGWKGNQDHLGEALPRTPGENPACPTLDIRADVIDGAALRAASRPPAGLRHNPDAGVAPLALRATSAREVREIPKGSTPHQWR